MGRTARGRRRKMKKFLSHVAIDDSTILKSLEDWMLSLDWLPVCNLKPSIFPSTGRGLMCLSDVSVGDTIVEIPKALLITTSSLVNSRILKIFLNEQSFDAQCTLAIFLAYERHLQDESVWKPYLDSLPKFYTNPDFCSTKEKTLLLCIVKDLEWQLEKIQFNFCSILCSIDELRKTGNHLCSHCDKPLNDVITFALFKWGYYTVNTRAVYIDSTKNVNKLIRVKGVDNIALAPFLDLFNHSYDASVEVSLVSDNKKQEFYRIKTLKPFCRGSQVYINYGSHDNSKLFIEYGFFIPDNPLDYVSFNFYHIEECLLSFPEFSNNFILSQSFHHSMGFTSEGINYNAKIVLFILSTELTEDQCKIKVYNGIFSCEDSLKINALAIKILDIRMSELVKQLSAMRQLKNGTESFIIAMGLVEEYINLLNRSLKQLCTNKID